MDFFKYIDPQDAERNIKKQATKVLATIAESYNKGVLDSPESAYTFCSLLACICEGKVQGLLDETTGEVKWSLTEKYQKELDSFLLRAAEQDENVVKGPW